MKYSRREQSTDDANNISNNNSAWVAQSYIAVNKQCGVILNTTSGSVGGNACTKDTGTYPNTGCALRATPAPTNT